MQEGTGGEVSRRFKLASFELTMLSLSQAWRLGGLHRRIRAERVAFQYVSPLSPPNRTCNFHCIRLSRSQLSSLRITPEIVTFVRFHSFTFRNVLNILRTCYYLSTRKTLTSWRPSPCTRLSRAPTTMTPPTLFSGIDRLLVLTSG